MESKLIDESVAKTCLLGIIIGENRKLGEELLQRVEKIALSSMVFLPGEQIFF